MSASAVKALDGLIIPEKIPGDDLWSGDVGAVADGLVASAKALRSGVDDVSTGWAGLPAVFVAPGAEVVYGAVAPASVSAHVFAAKVDVIAKALHHYADGLPVLKRTFAAIKADAVTFRAKIGADGRVWMPPQQTKKYEWDSKAQVGRSQFAAGTAQDAVDYLRSRGETARIHYGAVQLRALWTESGDFVDQNNRLLDRVADAYAALNKLEAECANKINTQRDDCVAEVVAVQGWQLKQSGAQTADLPWGHRVDEDRNCGESFWWGAGNAGLSMVQGLGSLISYNPTTNGWGDWGNAGKAWVGVGTGLGSLLLSTSPISMILAAAGVPLFKDAQTKSGDMLKSLVAWDTWSKNPSEAAGAVLVNVGTFFIPGAGEVGGVIKALTIGTKLEIVASALTKVEAVTSKVTSLIPDALGDLLTKLKTDKLDTNIDLHVEIPTDIHATIGVHPDTPTLHTGGGDHAPDLAPGGRTDGPVALRDAPSSDSSLPTEGHDAGPVASSHDETAPVSGSDHGVTTNQAEAGDGGGDASSGDSSLAATPDPTPLHTGLNTVNGHDYIVLPDGQIIDVAHELPSASNHIDKLDPAARITASEGPIIEGDVVRLPHSDVELPRTVYDKLLQFSLHHEDGAHLVLGKFPHYRDYAEAHQLMHFDLGDTWEAIQKKTGWNDREMFDLFNVGALREAQDAGKTVWFTKTPNSPTGAFGWEVEWMKDSGWTLKWFPEHRQWIGYPPGSE